MVFSKNPLNYWSLDPQGSKKKALHHVSNKFVKPRASKLIPSQE